MSSATPAHGSAAALSAAQGSWVSLSELGCAAFPEARTVSASLSELGCAAAFLPAFHSLS